MAMLLLLSVLVLLTQPPRSWGANVKILSRKPLIDDGTLVTWSPVENGLPGRDGRDGQDGPRGSPGATGQMGMLDVPKEDNSSAGEPGPKGDSGPRGPPGPAGVRGPAGPEGPSRIQRDVGPQDISALWRQLEALQGQVRRLQGAFLQYKKVELYPNGRDVGQKVFKTAGFVKSFYQAEQMCSQAGGQLPSPRSTAENYALQQLVEVENSGAAFLSMTDFWTEGRFTYPEGAPLVYSNWAPGEPNDDSGREDCVEIISNGKWNDVPCGAKRLVICEF